MNSRELREYLAQIIELPTPTLNQELRIAREIGAFDHVRLIEMVLLNRRALSFAMASVLLNIARRARASALRALAEQRNAPLRRALYGIFQQANVDTIRAAQQNRLRMAEEIIDTQQRSIDSVLTPAQKRSATGLPIDDSGLVKPKATTYPPVIRDQSLELDDVLLIASPLLAVTGYSLLAGAGKAIIKHTAHWLTMGSAKGIDTFSERMTRASINVRETTTRVLDLWERNPEGASKFLDTILGLNPNEAMRAHAPTSESIGGSGLARRVQTDQRHEMRRMYEQSLDKSRQESEVFAGYILQSAFAENTGVVHAHNDGLRFYKDDRKGSAKAWADRIVPPYDYPPCLCFTRDILSDSVGVEHIARWQLVDNPEYEIEPREIGTWASWFNEQRESIRRKLIGDARYNAAATRNREVSYQSLVRRDGRFMSARAILGESRLARTDRVQDVRKHIRTLRQQNLRAFAEGKGQWELSETDEVKYRRRLEQTLRRFSK